MWLSGARLSIFCPVIRSFLTDALNKSACVIYASVLDRRGMSRYSILPRLNVPTQRSPETSSYNLLQVRNTSENVPADTASARRKGIHEKRLALSGVAAAHVQTVGSEQTAGGGDPESANQVRPESIRSEDRIDSTRRTRANAAHE